MNITERQQRILKAIVSEYLEGGIPVGSANLVKKYDIPASPATVRYEMARLADEGLIKKPHRSGGRVPTIIGLRHYINELFDESVVDYMLELDVKKRLGQVKFDRELLLRESVAILAEKSGHLGFCMMDDGPRVGGITNLLVLDKETLATVFAVLEDDKMFRDILGSVSSERVVLLGDEIGLSGLESVAIVYQEVSLFGESGGFGVMGPIWLDYREILPLLSMVAQTAEGEASQWGKKDDNASTRATYNTGNTGNEYDGDLPSFLR